MKTHSDGGDGNNQKVTIFYLNAVNLWPYIYKLVVGY